LKTLRHAGEVGEIEASHPLPDGPRIFHRSTLGQPAAQRVGHRARQKPNHPTGSHPDQKNLFSSITIRPRRGWCSRLLADANGAQSTCNDGAIDTVTIANEVFCGLTASARKRSADSARAAREQPANSGRTEAAGDRSLSGQIESVHTRPPTAPKRDSFRATQPAENRESRAFAFGRARPRRVSRSNLELRAGFREGNRRTLARNNREQRRFQPQSDPPRRVGR
jgi:hypothetical protein